MAAPPPPSGLLSNVFSYVSREIECFVATATGGKPPEQPKASTSRVKLDGPQKVQSAGGGSQKRDAGDSKERVAGVNANAKTERQAGPSHRLARGVDAAEEGDGGAKKTQAVPIRSQHAGRRIAAATSPTPVPDRPVSLPNMQPRKACTTMPGSLFPRSASLEPDPTPAPGRGTARAEGSRPLMRYAPAARSQGFHTIDEEAGDTSQAVDPVLWRSPGSSANPFLVEDDAHHASRQMAQRRITSSTEDAIRFLNENHPSPRSSPSPMAPPTPEPCASTYRTVEEEDLPPRRSLSKGKERAHDPPYEFLRAETSQEIRIRGTEDELQRAREDQLRKEQELDPDTSLALEERERDKERIKFLEAEVARLRDQLSQQRSLNSRGLSPPPPPPPTPPPLPPPRRTLIPPLTVSSIRKRSAPHTRVTTDAFLQQARAALRKLNPPVEAPINFVTAPHAPMRRKSIAQPTVNVPSDKMADFLQEVRSAKLKKVSGTMAPPLVREEPASSALARAVSHTGRGRDILREMVRRKSMSHMDARAGDKRKRDAVDGDEFAVPPLPTKRLATQGSSASDTSTSSFASTSSNPFMDNSRSFSLTDLHNRTWPSITTTDTDITTPSLCSDNENDHASEAGHDLPPTPPRPHRSPEPSSEHDQEQDAPLPEIIEVIVDEEEGFFTDAADTPIAQSSAAASAFVRRPAVQPLPEPTPKKPRAASRSKIPRSHSQTRSQPEQHSQSNPHRSPPARAKSRAQPAGASRNEDAPPTSKIPVIDLYAVRNRALAQRPAKDHNARDSGPSERPRQPTNETQEPVQMSAHARRRRTLDEELKHAGDHLWSSDGPDEEDLEDGTLVGIGVKNNRGGFLARGGGGGSPVFMGVGYVQGAEDDRVRGRMPSRNGIRSVQ